MKTRKDVVKILKNEINQYNRFCIQNKQIKKVKEEILLYTYFLNKFGKGKYENI